MDSMSRHRDAQDVCAVSFLAHILLSSIYLNSNVGIRKAKFDENFNTTEEEMCPFVALTIHGWFIL